MYCELKSRFRYSRFAFLHELKSIFALLVLLIDMPLSLIDYHSQMYSIYDLTQTKAGINPRRGQSDQDAAIMEALNTGAALVLILAAGHEEEDLLRPNPSGG